MVVAGTAIGVTAPQDADREQLRLRPEEGRARLELTDEQAEQVRPIFRGAWRRPAASSGSTASSREDAAPGSGPANSAACSGLLPM